MKIKEIRELSKEEIGQKVEETTKELFNLRLQQSTGQLENAARIREVRRTIARLKTLAKEAKE